MNKKGFTMVELLAVIVILGILMGIAIPLIQKHLVDSKNKAMETLAKTSFEAAHSKALKDETLNPGVTSYNIQNLSTEGFMDKPIDPYDKSKLCQGEVGIDYRAATKDDALDNYIYKVRVKCSSKEIKRIYTTDGKEIDDYDGPFDISLVVDPSNKQLQYKDASNYRGGKITISKAAGKQDVLTTTYSSATTSICTVNSTNGYVTPKAAGTCTINAKVIRYDEFDNPLGEMTKTITFTVSSSYTPSFTLSANPTILYYYNSSNYNTGQVSASSSDVTFSSNDTSKCTISGKTVTPKTTGTCTIKGTINNSLEKGFKTISITMKDDYQSSLPHSVQVYSTDIILYSDSPRGLDSPILNIGAKVNVEVMLPASYNATIHDESYGNCSWTQTSKTNVRYNGVNQHLFKGYVTMRKTCSGNHCWLKAKYTDSSGNQQDSIVYYNAVNY